MQEILVKIPPFNYLRADKTNQKRLQSVPSIVKCVNSTDENDDEHLLNEPKKRNGGDRKGMDVFRSRGLKLL